MLQPTLLLNDLNMPLTESEHYNLARMLYGRSYFDGVAEWEFIHSTDEGFSPCGDTEMILTERRPQEQVRYHWFYARDMRSEELWVQSTEPGDVTMLG